MIRPISPVARTAGAAVDPVDLHDAHRAVKLLLAAVFERGELLGRGIEDPHGDVRAYGQIGLVFDLAELLEAQLPVEVDGHAVRGHVEVDVLDAVFFVAQAGEDVLAAVVLHAAQALFRVHGAGVMAGGKLAVAQMQDLAAALVHIEHARLADRSRVGRLAAALGEEGRAVEHDLPAALLLPRGEDPCLKFKQMAVQIIQFFAHVPLRSTRNG